MLKGYGLEVLGKLRRWFSHDPAKWKEFKRRYWEEIKYKKEFEELVKLTRERGI